jgi:acyl-CoA synthetase (AMP-forming)/AMP-acid ligase II/thioesterase domain-containing protein/acyl carrier protein
VFGNVTDQRSTVGREIQRHSERRPDHAALISSGFMPLSYRELQCLIEEVRAALRLAGFSRSARIVIAMPSGPQAALAIIAVACSAVSIPLDPRLSSREMEICLTALRPDAVLLKKGSDSAARQAAEFKGLAIIEATQSKDSTLGFSIVELQSNAAASPNEPDEPDPDAPAFILQTSGTAAEAKLVPFSHRNMLAAAARVQACFDLTPQDRCLSVSPVFYAHGLHATVFAPLLTGGTVAFPTDASKFDYSEWFGTLKPTWYAAGPTLHRLIFDQIKTRADAKAGHSLRFLLSGGASLPRGVLDGLQHALGVPVLELYGSSETAQIAANLPSPGRSRPGTVGVPWSDTILIVGDDGRQLPPGEQGEILARGPTVVSGYLDAPELNRTSFVNGWFKTGDIGSLDEEGFLTLHGRKDDLINRGGEKISPVEIDNALMRHPAIAEAAAFGLPHARLGEDVVAAVVLHSDKVATPVELRKYLGEQLASFKVPRRIIILNQLPKGNTGKVPRRQLSEWLSSEMAALPAAQSSSISSDLLFQLRELWERVLNSGPLSIDDDFFDNGGDSLLAVEMLTEVERLTGKAVPISNLFDTPTIRQLAKELSAGDNLKAKPLIRISSNGSQAPLFFFHGDLFGGGHYVKRLARLLGSDQPLFVIAPHGVDGTPIPLSIEAMAADSLSLIMNAQPQGPYRLAGWCIGGLVAFEAARMLLAAGKKVEMVIIIDAPTVNARRSVQTLLSILARSRPIMGPAIEGVMARAVYNLANTDRFSNLSALQLWWAWVKGEAKATVVSRIHRVLTALRANGPSVTDHAIDNDRTSEYASVYAYGSIYSGVLSHYLPEPLAVRVTYFQFESNGKAWLRMSSDLEVIKLSGGHESIITDPSDLAHHLRVRLRRESGADAQPSS